MIRLRIRWTASAAAISLIVLTATTVFAAVPPVTADDAYTTPMDTPLVEPAPGVLANDSDDDGDALSVLGLVSGPAHGSLTLNADGSFTYTPHAGYLGPDSFSYESTDGDNVGNVGLATISVVQADDPPPPACEPVTEFGGSVKSSGVNTVNSGRTLRLQVTVTCDGAAMSGLAPAVELHSGHSTAAALSAGGSTPVSSGVMTERDGKYVYELEVPAGAAAGSLYTVAVRPLGAGTDAAVAWLKVRR